MKNIGEGGSERASGWIPDGERESGRPGGDGFPQLSLFLGIPEDGGNDDGNSGGSPWRARRRESGWGPKGEQRD